jgi:hypothetical protein
MEEREKKGEKKKIFIGDKIKPSSKTCRRAFLDPGRCRTCCSKGVGTSPASLGEPHALVFFFFS